MCDCDCGCAPVTPDEECECIQNACRCTGVSLLDDLPVKERQELARAFQEVAEGKLKPFRRRTI